MPGPSHPGIMDDKRTWLSHCRPFCTWGLQGDLREADVYHQRSTARYTSVSLGHHFRGTAMPWESKVSFKHSEVLSYQSENEIIAWFSVPQDAGQPWSMV